MSLSIIKEKFKEQYFRIGIIIFLTSLLSFGIGYLIGRDWHHAPIIVNVADKQ
ncbi:MAG: hypothetical protein HYR95_00215 [Candidatus Colwellbacteria bacterium]|nr:hypothetical protein [Candidatus Colwellbacteria bacterium]